MVCQYFRVIGALLYGGLALESGISTEKRGHFFIYGGGLADANTRFWLFEGILVCYAYYGDGCCRDPGFFLV